jgi:hypothetical protein
MRQQLLILLASMLTVFLLGVVSGMAVERSLALNRANRQTLCREARQRRESIRITSLADLDKPEVQAEIRQAEADIEEYCPDGRDVFNFQPHGGHGLVGLISLLRCLECGQAFTRKAKPRWAFDRQGRLVGRLHAGHY